MSYAAEMLLFAKGANNVNGGLGSAAHYCVDAKRVGDGELMAPKMVDADAKCKRRAGNRPRCKVQLSK